MSLDYWLSWLPVICAVILSFFVLSSGYAKLNAPPPTPILKDSQVAKDPNTRSKDSISPISPAMLRKAIGFADMTCGVMLLVPSRRQQGAATSGVLLLVGMVTQLRNGVSPVPALVLMGMSAFVWYS